VKYTNLIFGRSKRVGVKSDIYVFMEIYLFLNTNEVHVT